MSGNENEQVVTKKKKWVIPVIIGGVAVVLAACIAMFLIVVFAVAMPAKKLKNQLELGYKYVMDMDYEKAILTYKAIIDANPKNVEAYLGIADAYEGLADRQLDAADPVSAYETLKTGAEVLDEGYQKTNSKEVRDRFDDLEKMKNDLIPVEIAAEQIPESLSAFVNHFCWYGEDYFRGETAEEIMNVTMCMFQLSFFGDFDKYPVEIETGDVWDDPRILNAGGVDWVLANVYNFDGELIQAIKEADFLEKNDPNYNPDWKSWTYDEATNTYRTRCGGIGDGPISLITRVEKRGNFYFIKYDIYDSLGWELEPESTRYAVFEQKEVNGFYFWSLHYDGITTDYEFGEAEDPNSGMDEYSDEELAQMALDYYCKKVGQTMGASAYKSKVMSKDEHLVTICVYEEGYSAVDYMPGALDWFCVDNRSAKGNSVWSGAVVLAK